MSRSTHCESSRRRWASGEFGSALVMALLATVLLSALGLGLLTLTTIERAISVNYRAASETLYAADAVAERALVDIRLVPRWTDLLNGSARSSFAGGTLTPAVAGTTIDLVSLTAQLQAQSDSSASWGPNNPQWRLYAYGHLSQMTPTGSIQSPAYVVVWVADDPSETDNDPWTDSNGMISLLAQAFGRDSSIRFVEMTLAKPAARPDPDQPSSDSGEASEALGVRILSWREIR